MSRHKAHNLVPWLLLCSAPAFAQRVTVEGERPWYGDLDARARLSQLFSNDLDTPSHLHFTDVRLNLDTTGIFADDLELHVDGRWRHGWTDVTHDRNDVTRLYLQWGNRKTDWTIALGRQVILPAFSARLDGAHIGLRFGDIHLGAFGGLKPHPLTADLDPDFTTAGIVYDARSERANHAGGAVIDLFTDRADRIYLTERAHVRLADDWSVSGHVVVDFLAPRGIIDELELRQNARDDFAGGLDLTSANLMLRYRDPTRIGVSLSGLHTHTILPSVWWQDWVREERARRGFVVDGAEPVGTRRSSVRLNADLYVSRLITPYVKLRYDRRHNDDADGWEGRPGVKLILGPDAWIDASYSWRQYFTAINNHVSVSTGITLLGKSSLEAHASFMHSRRRGVAEGEELYDFGGLLRAGFGDFSDALDGTDLIIQYQGFLDRGSAMHVFFLQLGYRVRS